jgi:hypothetical protein
MRGGARRGEDVRVGVESAPIFGCTVYFLFLDFYSLDKNRLFGPRHAIFCLAFSAINDIKD